MNRQQQIEQFLIEAHSLALERLRAEPARLADVAAQLHRWRAVAGESRTDPYWAEWEALIAAGVGAVERAVSVDTDRAAALRSVSPLSVLITQQERAAMLRDVRSAT